MDFKTGLLYVTDFDNLYFLHSVLIIKKNNCQMGNGFLRLTSLSVPVTCISHHILIFHTKISELRNKILFYSILLLLG